MSNSFEFSIEIEDQQEGGFTMRGTESTIYQALEEAADKDFARVLSLQELVKSQWLLLEYEEKRKNERLKEIEYTYVNAFTNYLWTHAYLDRKDAFILLNPKDIISLHDSLPEHLHLISRRLHHPKPLPFRNDLKPPPSFLNDFMNFWPQWHTRVAEIMQLEIAGSDRIETTFESQYSFASKLLSNLRLNDRIQRFCAGIFEPVLVELEAVSEELIVDFSGLYEKWGEELRKLPLLKRFIDGGDVETKAVRHEIEELYGRIKGEQEAQILLQEMIHFQRKDTAITFLLSEVGEEEIPEGLNLRLAWLVWKKILANRKKLQSLATSLLASIVEAYPLIPSEVKYVVRCFKETAEKKFGPLRFEDLKSFFNKVVFSQLFFAEFMSLYETRAQSISNVNLTLLALISQKIMFGQQFYEKYKFGFLNPTIVHYIPSIKQFILGFVSESIHSPPSHFLSILLTSLQSLRFYYEVIRAQTGALSSLQIVLCNTSCHSIANKNYPLKNMYVTLVEKPNLNYTLILKPNDKIKRILIQFLLLIDKIAEKNSIAALFEQYRCAEEDPLSTRPSVQLYAIYLQEVLHLQNWKKIIDEIQQSIEQGKINIERVKIGLEKEHNYSHNMEKMYMKMLSNRRKEASRLKIEAQINHLMVGPLGFDYQIVDGKVCESSESRGDKTMKRCLIDIAECFLNNYEGVDGLYHIFLERMVQQLQKGVCPDNMMDNAKSIIGKKLYSILKLDKYQSEKDLIIYKKMEKHSFITLTMLDIPKYQDEEELILIQAGKFIEELGRPSCPDRLLRIFNDITLVFENVLQITGSAADITADVQIPLMIVTIIRSKVRNIFTIIDFVQKFCTDQIQSSSLGQTFALLKSVVYFIEHQIDHKKLNLSQEEYDRLILSSEFVIIE